VDIAFDDSTIQAPLNILFETLVSELTELKIEEQDYLFPVNINYIDTDNLTYDSLPIATKYLKGAPNEVKNNFSLSGSDRKKERRGASSKAEKNIEDLSGCPQIVPGKYDISTEKIKSLQNTPDQVDTLSIRTKVENLDINHFPQLNKLHVNTGINDLDYVDISNLEEYLSETSKGEREKSLQDFEFEFKPQLESGELITNPEHIETLLSNPEQTNIISDISGKINVTPNNDGSVNLSTTTDNNKLTFRLDNSAYNKLPFNINELQDNFVSLRVFNEESQDLQSLEEFPSSIDRMHITAKSMPNNVPKCKKYNLRLEEKPIENFDYFPDEVDKLIIQSRNPITSWENLPVINGELSIILGKIKSSISIDETIKIDDFIEIIKNKTKSANIVEIDPKHAFIIYEYHTGDITREDFEARITNEINK
jgi:hypothetical protein